jgi:RNA polymerase sigma factor (sigma-70 family)
VSVLNKPSERLAERASAGDRRAFAAIFERYHQPLYRFCAAIVGNPEDAQDALQNTMVKVLASLPGEERRIELKPWLYRVAHNEAIEIVRRRRETDAVDVEQLGALAGADSVLESRERLRQLVADLRALPDRQRGALVMRELGGLSFEEIGSSFETSPRVARQTVYEARSGLEEMELGRGMACEEIRRKLSDGDRRIIRRRDVRAHLRGCRECSDFEASIATRGHDLAAIAPLPAAIAAGILKGVAGGAAAGGAASGAGIAGAGAGAGKALGASALVKTVAAAAVVAAIGVGAADRGGLVHVFGGHRGSNPPAGAAGGDLGAPGSSSVESRGGVGGGADRVGRGDRSGAGAARAARAARHARAARGHHGSPSAVAGTGASPGSGEAEGNPHEGAHGPSSSHGSGAANAHGANPHAGSKAAAGGGNRSAQGSAKSGAGKSHTAHSGRGSASAPGHAKAPKQAAEPAPKAGQGPAAQASKPVAPSGKPEG